MGSAAADLAADAAGAADLAAVGSAAADLAADAAGAADSAVGSASSADPAAAADADPAAEGEKSQALSRASELIVTRFDKHESITDLSYQLFNISYIKPQ